jgi:hypothetical protein
MENEDLNNEKLIALFNNLNMLAKLQTQKLNEFGQKLDLMLGEFNKKFELMLNSPNISANKEIDFPEAIIPPIEEYKNNLQKVETKLLENQISEKPAQEEKKYFVQRRAFTRTFALWHIREKQCGELPPFSSPKQLAIT